MLNSISIENTFQFEVNDHLTNTHSLFQLHDLIPIILMLGKQNYRNNPLILSKAPLFFARLMHCSYVKCEILKEVIIWITLFCLMTPCRLIGYY